MSTSLVAPLEFRLCANAFNWVGSWYSHRAHHCTLIFFRVVGFHLILNVQVFVFLSSVSIYIWEVSARRVIFNRLLFASDSKCCWHFLYFTDVIFQLVCVRLSLVDGLQSALFSRASIGKICCDATLFLVACQSCVLLNWLHVCTRAYHQVDNVDWCLATYLLVYICVLFDHCNSIWHNFCLEAVFDWKLGHCL